MEIKEFQSKVLRTDLEDYSGFQQRLKENKTTVHSAIKGFMLSTATLDLMKKKIAYDSDMVKLLKLDAEHTIALKNFESSVFLDKISENEKLSQLLHYIIGIATETNEMMLALAKAAITGDLDLVNIGEENADALWYQGVMCERLGLDMGKLLEANINKLQVRYPHKFTNKDANNRNLEEERLVLTEGI